MQIELPLSLKSLSLKHDLQMDGTARFVVRILDDFSDCLNLLCEFVRRQIAERGVGSVIVVVASPFLYPLDHVDHRQE